MNINENVAGMDNVRIQRYNKDGVLVQEESAHNLVVTAGKNWIAGRIDDTPPTGMSHMAVGTGTTSPAVGDTTLETELDRNALDSVVNSSNTTTYTCTWAAGDGTGALTEAGILNAAGGGTLLARVTFAVVNKAADDTIVIVWDVTIN